MHGVAATIGNPGFIIGATLISLALRKNPVWAPVLTPLFATAVLIWISLMLMIAFLFALAPGTSGPSAVGWTNRLLVIAYGAWLMIAAQPVLRIGQR